MRFVTERIDHLDKRADPDDETVAHGDSLSPRTGRIDGDDLVSDEHSGGGGTHSRILPCQRFARRADRDKARVVPGSSTTMKAAIYRRPGDVEIVDVDRPAGAGVIVAVDHCGICGTDLHMVLDGWGTPDTIFGHEWSGQVVHPGDSDLAVGALVVGVPSAVCGQCEQCLSGRTSLCRHRPTPGNTAERGAFAEFVELDKSRLVSVPEGVSGRAAAYTEPLAVALHAVTLSEIRDDQTSLVFGAGPIGAAIIAILAARGIPVAAVEPHERRAALAASLGATVRSAEQLDVPAHPGEISGNAVEVVFETSGARVAAEDGLTQLAGGGVLMLVGTGLDYPKLDTNRLILNELRVTGAFNYDADGFRDALALIADGALPLDLLIEEEVVDLDGLLDVMQRLRAGEVPGKVMVKP